MAEGLFPEIEIPDIDINEETEGAERYYPSVYFDFEKGDFVLDGAKRMVQADGLEAYMQWCMKVISTERESFLAYSSDIGTEFEEIMGDPDRSTRESEIEETISEALMVHPCTEFVGEFTFEHEADACYVSIKVKGYGWAEQELTVAIETS